MQDEVASGASNSIGTLEAQCGQCFTIQKIWDDVGGPLTTPPREIPRPFKSKGKIVYHRSLIYFFNT